MIDPKLNATPSPESAGAAKDKEALARLQKVSAGLSVKDTVSANADLSTGGRGVDTSGVSAGSGAGAGMTRLTNKDSMVPQVVPDGRGSGTTALGAGATQASQSNMPGANASAEFADEEISALAYQAWCDRGCPIGSPEVDWETAANQLRSRRTRAVGA